MLFIQLLNFLEINLRKPTTVLFLSLAILVFYLSPLFIDGEDLYIMTFDNLDSNIVWLKILAQSGMLFADSNTIIPNMMGGLPRHTYGSEFNAMVWFFYFFPPFTAYIINEVLMHTVAFGAMWVLLSHHFVKPLKGNFIYIATGSLYFALLPYWPGGGLSIPAMPLVIYALLNIRSGNAKWSDWTILALVPLYSSFVIVYFFFLLAAGTFWVIDSIRKRKWQWQFIGAIIFMGVVYLGVEYRLVYSTFFAKDFISHRIEFTGLFIKSAIKAYEEAYSVFLNGHNLAKGNHYLFLLPLIFVGLLIKWKERKFTRSQSLIVALILALTYTVDFWNTFFVSIYFFPLCSIVLLGIMIKKWESDVRLEITLLLLIGIALWSGFWYYKGWSELKVFFPYLETFNLSRLLYLEPFLWALISVFTVMIIGKKMAYPAVIIVLFWISISYIAVNNATFHHSFLAKKTYKEYYSENIFRQIRQYIGKPNEQYRLASLGIEPAVSLYNGFFTIDGYCVNYPLEYKYRFRKIFEMEIPKNKYIHWVYDQWGSKCYIMTRAVKYDSKGRPVDYAHLELDTNAMYELGARYMITPVKIPDPSKGFQYEKSFNDDENINQKIYLYKVIRI